MKILGWRCLISRIIHKVPTTLIASARRAGSKIYRNPKFAENRNIIMLEYKCSQCKSDNSQILLSEMYQKSLVVVKCTTCTTPYCLGEQLQWFRDICEKNPKLLEALSKKGDLILGVITTDFETVLMERKLIRKIVKRDDATDMIGIDYHQNSINKKIEVNLLKFVDLEDS